MPTLRFVAFGFLVIGTLTFAGNSRGREVLTIGLQCKRTSPQPFPDDVDHLFRFERLVGEQVIGE